MLNQVLHVANDVYIVALAQVFATHPIVLLLVQLVFFKLHNSWVYNPVPNSIEEHAVDCVTAIQIPFISLVPIHSTPVEVLVQLARILYALHVDYLT